MSEMLVSIGGKLKATKSADGRFATVEGLGVRFATHEEPDLEGDFFDGTTYFGKRQGDGTDATLNHTFPIITKNLDVNKELEGYADSKFTHAVKTEKVDFGLIGKHVLDLANEFEAWVAEMVDQGAFRWSTGATSHTARTTQVGDAHHIDRWDIGEFAYTPTPAEPRLPAIMSFKSIQYEPLDVTRGPESPDNKTVKIISNDNTGDKKMDPEQIKLLVETAVASALKGQGQPDFEQLVTDAVKAALPQDTDDNTEEVVTAAIEAAMKAWEAKQPANNDPGFNVPNVVKMSNLWKYDHMEVGDHALAVSLLNASAGHKNVNGGIVQNASLDMVKSLAIKLANDDQKDVNGRPLHSRTKAAMAKSFAIGFSDKELHAAKADELNYSTQSGFGDEWIGVAYANELWPRIVQDTPVLNRIPTMEVPQGAESVVIPLDGAPPTFYKVAQATAQDSNPGPVTRTVTTSKQATARQTLSVETVGAATDWTGHMNEDAVVNFAAELRRNIQQEAAEVMEAIAIDGDTAAGATTNINDIGGTPAGNESFLVANGFRKLALVTNTANSRDGGVLAIEDFLETIKLMGLAGRNAINKDRVSFISDLWTHWKTLELAEVKTRDVFVAPTVENGMLTNLYGYDYIASANMHRANQDATFGLKANAAGKVDLDTAANNTTGALLAVRWDQWRWGFKRRITFEVERVPRADSFEITALMRVGMINRDTEASAISYNLTV